MTDFRKDMARLQSLVGDAFTSTGALVALADGGRASSQKVQRELEQTAAEFEKTALELRALCEKYSPGVGGYGKAPCPPPVNVAGSAETINGDWLHIKLNTLLPHCRYRAPSWLADTLRRVLDSFESGGGKIPYFTERAMLIIDEHSDVDGRMVFDQDNKGWKVVSNALKGRAVPDDDQYTLGLALISTRSAENVCHITLLDMRDAADFFALHSSSCAASGFCGEAGAVR